MLLSSGAFEPMPIAIHRRNRDAWNLKDRKPKHNSTKLCMCVKGRKNVNIMLMVFAVCFLTSRFMMSVFKNGFHFVWMCLSLEMVLVCMLQYKNTYWIKFHRLLIFCLLFIYWYIHPLRIDRDSQGFYLLAFVCVWVFVFKNVFLFFSFDRVHEYNVSLNYCE